MRNIFNYGQKVCKGKDHLRDLVIDVRMILKYILEIVVWTRLNWLRFSYLNGISKDMKCKFPLRTL
jgi:hypothetical protein